MNQAERELIVGKKVTIATPYTAEFDVNLKDRRAALYLCYWGEGYGDKPKVELHGMSSFTEEKGYDEEDLEKVKRLNIGEAVNLTRLSDIHYVLRVK